MRYGYVLLPMLSLLPIAAATKPCPATVGITAQGAFYAERGGAWVRQSPRTVEEVLRGGCYPEGGPSPTSSVLLEIAPHAPVEREKLMYDLLARTGWPREKLRVVVWENAPDAPKAQ
jgi:hypothetical protein